ncbi:trypsin-7-like [Cloeon dipterum]|uniref:trypsin-7-like n=1 Tax=Cloeon dipterum TaxID=197152 RepID=UPI00321FAA77
MLLKTVLVLAGCAALASGSPKPLQQGLSSRIVGGTPAVKGEFPWHVSIQLSSDAQNWVHVCDGAIVSNEFILTDINCRVRPDDFGRVVAGTLNWTDPGSIHTVAENIIGEPFFALLRMDPPFEFNSDIGPIQLPTLNEESVPGTAMTVSGMGEIAPFEPSQELVKLDVIVVPKTNCESIYYWQNLTNVLCVEDGDNEANMCTDRAYGCPLVFDGELRGLFDYELGDVGQCVYPALYNEVSPFRNWIQEVTGV